MPISPSIVIDVQGGTLSFSNGYQFSSGSTINLASGSELQLPGFMTANSVINKTGTGTLNIDQLKGDQAQPFTLTLNGDYTLATATGGPKVTSIGATVINNGTVRLLSGSLRNLNSVLAANPVVWRNTAGSTLELGSAVAADFLLINGAHMSASLINEVGATLLKKGTGSSTIQWDAVNDGAIDVQGGQLSVQGNVSGTGSFAIDNSSGLIVFSDTFTADALSVAAGGSFDFLGGRLEVQNFTGNFNHSQGVFAPGASPAISTLVGDYTMTGTSIFEFEIADTISGQYDQLFVTGNVDLLGGSLAVSTLNSFNFSANQSFLFMDIAGTLTGEFFGLNEGSLVGVFGENLYITYLAGDGNDIALFTSTVPIPPTVWLFGSALGLLGGRMRKRKHRN